MSTGKNSFSEAIESCEHAISAAESDLDAARSALYVLRQLLKVDAHEEGAPDPAAERKRLESWNRMAVAKGETP